MVDLRVVAPVINRVGRQYQIQVRSAALSVRSHLTPTGGFPLSHRLYLYLCCEQKKVPVGGRIFCPTRANSNGSFRDPEKVTYEVRGKDWLNPVNGR
jgi:hypothetical protein